MSLMLDREGSDPNVRVMCMHDGCIAVGQHEVVLEDFLSAALYVLGNTDLKPNDPRLQFVETVKSLKQVDGWMAGRERLAVAKD